MFSLVAGKFSLNQIKSGSNHFFLIAFSNKISCIEDAASFDNFVVPDV